jgi:arabinofuranan 3-O-arabinosyltransferase
VSSGGVVALPAAVHGRAFRLDVLAARWPGGTPGRVRRRRAVGIGELHGAGVTVPVRVPRTGTVALPCGSASVTVDGVPYGLRARVDRAALDAGRPVRLEGCGPLRLPARDVALTGSTGPLRVDGLRLTSVPPSRVAHAAVAGGGTVVDAGHDEHGGRSGVRLDVRGPSYLVLGESFDRGWRATCDGRDLGTPRPLQGYADAWPVDRGCRAVAFSYRPQRLADAGYLISAVGCAALLALLAAGAWRRRRRGAAGSPAAVVSTDHLALSEPPAPTGLRVAFAVAVALPAAVVIGGTFGLRAGAVAAPLLAALLWRGVADRALGYAVLGLLGVVVPAIYAGVWLFGGEHVLGGNSTQYGADRLAAHWVAVAAFVLLAVLLWRTLAAARSGRRTPDSDRDPLPSRR